MATHSRILAWGIPWLEKPGGLQSMGSQRIRHNLVTEQASSVADLSLSEYKIKQYMLFIYAFVYSLNKLFLNFRNNAHPQQV